MEAWEIQQKINGLKWRRSELESEISQLEDKKEYLQKEYSRKTRQASQMSSFYAKKRSDALTLKGDAKGNAVLQMLDQYGIAYGAGNEEKIASSIRSVQAYLKSNCDNIDERIEYARGRISSINWEIYCYEKDLRNMESEV